MARAADDRGGRQRALVNRLMRRSLLRISADMQRSSPVFIVGEARSGTSILYRTLQKHSSFRPRQTNLAETNIFAHLRRTFMFGQSYPETLRQFMLDDMVA